VATMMFNSKRNVISILKNKYIVIVLVVLVLLMCLSMFSGKPEVSEKIGRRATGLDFKVPTLEVTKQTESYDVNISPSCWSLDCYKENNWHAKTPCGNELSTKWNLLGVEAMNRYLQGDRKSSCPYEDLMNVNLNKAISYFIKAVASDTSCARAHMNLALAYTEYTQMESALHHATTAVKLSPSEARFHAFLSFIDYL